MGTWCGPCQSISDDILSQYIAFGYNTQDVIILSIDTGSDDYQCLQFVNDFMQGEESFPIISGTEGGGNQAHNLYGISGVPTIITINPDYSFTETHLSFPEYLTTNIGIIPIIVGCTDPSAFNYNENVIEDDGSCIPLVEGCTSDLYLEYNPLANTDDGSCSILIIYGCIEMNAFNYDADANTDDGSCYILVLIVF
jgi:hypothetical protein